MATEGNYPKSDGDVAFASEYNLFEADRWNTLNNTTTPILGILPHSATSWTGYNGTSSVITTDTGASWVASTGDNADMTGAGTVSKADGTKAIVADHDSANVSFYNGTTWASSSTDPAAITEVFDITFPTATVAAMGVDKGAAGKGIFKSSNAGDAWSEVTTGPAVDVPVIDMIDADTGIAIDNAGNIWSADGDIDVWSDSGQNAVVSPTQKSSMVALSSTNYVLINLNQNFVETGNTTSGGTIRLHFAEMADADFTLSNLVKITNGNLYFMVYVFGDGATVPRNTYLYRSTDNGVNWSTKNIMNGLSTPTIITTNVTKATIVEYTTNKMLALVGDQTLMIIDESGA